MPVVVTTKIALINISLRVMDPTKVAITKVNKTVVADISAKCIKFLTTNKVVTKVVELNSMLWLLKVPICLTKVSTAKVEVTTVQVRTT